MEILKPYTYLGFATCDRQACKLHNYKLILKYLKLLVDQDTYKHHCSNINAFQPGNISCKVVLKL